jgi:hypothetical protein
MKTGYPPCPCATCQEVLREGDGPRKPCLYGRTFENATYRRALEDAKSLAAFGRLCGSAPTLLTRS